MKYAVYITPLKTRKEPDGLHVTGDTLDFEADRYEMQPDGSVRFYVGERMIGGFKAGEFFGIILPS